MCKIGGAGGAPGTAFNPSELLRDLSIAVNTVKRLSALESMVPVVVAVARVISFTVPAYWIEEVLPEVSSKIEQSFSGFLSSDVHVQQQEIILL